MDIRAHRAYKCQMEKHLSEPRPSTRTRSTAIGAAAVGAQTIGAEAIKAQTIGGLAICAVAVGAAAIGALAIGRLVIRRTRLDAARSPSYALAAFTSANWLSMTNDSAAMPRHSPTTAERCRYESPQFLLV
jgi:hypothetical protein